MRKIQYFENLKGYLNYNEISREQLEAYKGYDNARKYNLSMPLLTDAIFVHMGVLADVYSHAGVGKFIFAIKSDSTLKSIAQLFLSDYKICDVVDMRELLGDNCYITTAEMGLVISKKYGR